ncbi:MAG: hypothetical protein QOJ89_1863 [bacterium]|jgi:hypothetical protein
MRTRVGNEDGFTLVELLAALVVGMIVLFAVFGLLDTAVRLQARTVDGIETTDRGRVAIDRISQGLGSRICLGNEPSLVEGDDDHVEYYASLAPESSVVRLIVQRREVAVVGTSIREQVWTSNPPLGPPNLPPASSTTPVSNREIVAGVHKTGSTPVFRYYARDGAGGEPTVLLPTPLSAVDLRRAELVEVTFTAQGKRGDVSTAYTNRILTRSTTCV